MTAEWYDESRPGVTRRRFIEKLTAAGAATLELNLEPSEGSHYFEESRHGPAGELVPAWVREVLGD